MTSTPITDLERRAILALDGQERPATRTGRLVSRLVLIMSRGSGCMADHERVSLWLAVQQHASRIADQAVIAAAADELARLGHCDSAGTDAGFSALGEGDRVESRMLTDERQWTDELDAQLRQELADWRRTEGAPGNKRADYPISKLSERIGVAASVLSEWLKGKYRGDVAGVARKVDQFLADEKERQTRQHVYPHTSISLSHKIFGVIRYGIVHGTMPVIIGPNGCGKSAHAAAFARERAGAVVVRIENAPATTHNLSRQLCESIPELRSQATQPHGARWSAIKAFFARRRSAVLIIDEAQKLAASGLELLRDLHDAGDSTGDARLPVVFCGDDKFYRLILATRAGKPSPIAPQMIRRMMPLFDIERDGAIDGDGTLYSVDDILAIVNRDRIKLLNRQTARWVTDLANVPSFGALGLALQVLNAACELMLRKGQHQLDVELLRTALNMSAGRSLAIEIDQAAGGELLAMTA